MPAIASPIFYSTVPPREGSRQFPITATLTGPYTLPIVADVSQSGMASIRSALIDNSGNPGTLTVQIADSLQLITVAPYCRTITPIFTNSLVFNANLWCSNENVLINGYAFWSGGSFQRNVNIVLFNFAQEYSVNYVGNTPDFQASPITGSYQAPNPLSAGVVAIPASGTTWTKVLNPNNLRCRLAITAGNVFSAAGDGLIFAWGDQGGNGGGVTAAMKSSFTLYANPYPYVLQKAYESQPFPTTSLWALSNDTVVRNVLIEEWGW